MSRRPRRRGRRARDEETAGERQHRAVVSFHAHHNTTKIAKFHLNSAKNFSLYGSHPVRSPPYLVPLRLSRTCARYWVADETTPALSQTVWQWHQTGWPICRSARLAALGRTRMVAHATISEPHGVRFGGGETSRRPERRERWPPMHFGHGVLPVAANVRTGCVARERRAPEEARLYVLRRVRVALLDSASAFRAPATIARAAGPRGLLGFLGRRRALARRTTMRPSHSPCRYLRHCAAVRAHLRRVHLVDEDDGQLLGEEPSTLLTVSSAVRQFGAEFGLRHSDP